MDLERSDGLLRVSVEADVPGAAFVGLRVLEGPDIDPWDVRLPLSSSGRATDLAEISVLAGVIELEARLIGATGRELASARRAMVVVAEDEVTEYVFAFSEEGGGGGGVSQSVAAAIDSQAWPVGGAEQQLRFSLSEPLAAALRLVEDRLLAPVTSLALVGVEVRVLGEDDELDDFFVGAIDVRAIGDGLDIDIGSVPVSEMARATLALTPPVDVGAWLGAETSAAILLNGIAAEEADPARFEVRLSLRGSS